MAAAVGHPSTARHKPLGGVGYELPQASGEQQKPISDEPIHSLREGDCRFLIVGSLPGDVQHSGREIDVRYGETPPC